MAMTEPMSDDRLDGYEPDDYLNALSGDGPIAYWWSDKPHQLMYRTVAEIKRLRAENERLVNHLHEEHYCQHELGSEPAQ